jgi:hypothetical protein
VALEVVPLKTRKTESDKAIVATLEKLLEQAKSGQVHRLIVIGYDDQANETYRIVHRAEDIQFIGALFATATRLAVRWEKQVGD